MPLPQALNPVPRPRPGAAGPCLGLSPEAFYAANQPIPEACFPGGKWANMMAVAPYMGGVGQGNGAGARAGLGGDHRINA